MPSKSKTKVVMRRMRMRMMKVVVNGDNSGGTPTCPPRWYLGALRTLFCKAGHGVRPSGNFGLDVFAPPVLYTSTAAGDGGSKPSRGPVEFSKGHKWNRSAFRRIFLVN